MRFLRRTGFAFALITIVGAAVAQTAVLQPPAATPASERPVIIEGVVPDQATKAKLLASLQGVYGAGRVVDRIQVEDIATPPNWGTYVANMLTPGLKRVSAGKLEINGQSIAVRGEVANEALRQQVASDLSLASNANYTVVNGLKVGGRQQLLDQTLANRIVEFQSGSAQLTPYGAAILDEMVAKMAQMPSVRFLVVGHTDNVGKREANITLSQARALAVRSYMESKGLPSNRIDIQGKGPDTPVADNATDAGRARNRRIEFKVQ